MSFSQYKYERVCLTPVDSEVLALPGKMKATSSFKELMELYSRYERFHDHLITMYNLALMRNTINTRDEFYDAEIAYYDANMPVADELYNAVNDAMVASPYRAELKAELGEIYFKNSELHSRAFDSCIMQDIAEENALQSSYQKLMASSRIDFRGETLTLSQLSPYKESPDRQLRQEAFFAEGGFLAENREELDGIFDKLVALRSRMANKLGFKSFTDMAYCRRLRNCYTKEDVARFRELVVKSIVPLNNELIAQQHRRNGISDPKAYDRTLVCKNGNAMPKDTPDVIFENGKKMYEDMSPETGEFFRFMLKEQLFDVMSKDGKANGGYCDVLPDFKAPFVFANFDGTAEDVNVLTHECGHAFEGYLSQRSMNHFEKYNITMDIAEIHSTTMEFLTYPYMKNFFYEDADKYIYAHLFDCLKFLPYGCMVDHFQEIVYDHPDLSPEQRHQEWLRLEAIYRPDIDYADIPHYSDGGWWQHQLHIYMYPFYYIDYCLAQATAMMFYQISLTDRKDAWNRYLQLVKKSGTLSYLDLVRSAGLRTPFEPGAMESLADVVKVQMSKINTTDF